MLPNEVWKPGSFTKNFSWGENTPGLQLLHKVIRVGFSDVLNDVPRTVFRARLREQDLPPDFIPINFFLFNKPINGVDHIIVDELVFHALTRKHSAEFDRLALFAFNFSFVGKWKGSSEYQRRPALWANAYIAKRVAGEFNWDTKKISADDIEKFVASNPRYEAKTSRKLATNLNFLYAKGGLSGFASERIERWWVDALFLALDRLCEDRALDGKATTDVQYVPLLSNYGFVDLTGPSGLEKQMAMSHLVRLYTACGGRDRFSEDSVKERMRVLLSYVENYLDEDRRPQGAIHPTNPKILKVIPKVCAMLAKYAGFEVLEADEVENFDLEEFVKSRTRRALVSLRDRGIEPIMTADELLKITRGK